MNYRLLLPETDYEALFCFTQLERMVMLAGESEFTVVAFRMKTRWFIPRL